MHPLPNYLLCQIVCLSSDFDDAAVVVDAKQGVGGVFTVVHRETELLCAFTFGRRIVSRVLSFFFFAFTGATHKLLLSEKSSIVRPLFLANLVLLF